MAFNTFTVLCKQYLYPGQNTQKGNPSPIKQSILILLSPQPWVVTHLLSLSLDLPILGISFKLNLIMCGRSPML